ncbi:MAG: hypothetical protein M3R43_06630 [Acidobacteriota bacterium]|nr:hypothetical protein [Acidobacteriota bacterium]
MGLAEDLLSQAHHLAGLDLKRPKQASLRRSISTAYYAVFHLLIAGAVVQLIRKGPPGLRPRVGRAFSHGEMRQACLAFKRQPLVDPLLSLIGAPVSTELRDLATAFIDLQEERHSADYDTGAVFSRAATLAVLAKAESAFRNWRAVENADEARAFLAALAFGSRWSK